MVYPPLRPLASAVLSTSREDKDKAKGDRVKGEKDKGRPDPKDIEYWGDQFREEFAANQPLTFRMTVRL